MKMQTVAAILRAWVGERRLVDAAGQLGIGVSTLSMHMRGTYVPWDRQVRRMAPVLGIDADKLAGIADRDRRAINRRKARAAKLERKPRAKAGAA